MAAEIKIIECHNIEEMLEREWEEDRREAWAKELLAEMREQDAFDV